MRASSELLFARTRNACGENCPCLEAVPWPDSRVGRVGGVWRARGMDTYVYWVADDSMGDYIRYEHRTIDHYTSIGQYGQ
jgi:hypothetical protein